MKCVLDIISRDSVQDFLNFLFALGELGGRARGV